MRFSVRAPGRRRFLCVAGRAIGAALLAPAAWAQQRAQAIHDATRNTIRGAVGVRVRRTFSGADRARTYKPYRDARRTPLPSESIGAERPLSEVLRGYRPARAFGGRAVPLATLARVLEAANGVTGRSPAGRPLRAAPSAGALYAGEVYVVAERIDGLARGLYYYSPLTRELALLRRGSRATDVAAALEEPERMRGAAAAVLLSNVFPRYRRRYANRGYRYALIDSGHIAENLRLSAASAGLDEWGPLRFRDEVLNELVAIDGVDEAVCAMHLVGVRDDDGTDRAGAAARHFIEAATAARSLPPAVDDAPERYHASTMLVPEPSEDVGTPRPPPEVDEAEDEVESDVAADAGATHASGRLRLPPRAKPATTVEAAIRSRRSARHFLREPIRTADLGWVIYAAVGHATLVRTPGVALVAFVHRAIDRGAAVTPGLYRVDASGLALSRVRSGDLSLDLVAACLGQQKAGEAAVGIAMIADLVTAARRGGDRSYRDLCIEAGAVGQRIYLAAESVGLAARNLAAFADARLNDLAGVDGRRRAVLHLTMLGPGD